MIAIPTGARIYLALGSTDMRKGFDGLSMLAQQALAQDPFSGSLFVFRGKRGDLLKILWWDGQGFCLFAKRLEKGRFLWPVTKDGVVTLTAGAALHVARRHRLAGSTAHVAAECRGMTPKQCRRSPCRSRSTSSRTTSPR